MAQALETPHNWQTSLPKSPGEAKLPDKQDLSVLEKEIKKMPQTNSRSRSARFATDDVKPSRRVKRKSSRSKRPKGLAGYWVEIGMIVLIAAFLCPVVLYNLVNRIPTSGSTVGGTASNSKTPRKNAVITPTESFFGKPSTTPRNAQRPDSSIFSRFNNEEVLPPERQNKIR